MKMHQIDNEYSLLKVLKDNHEKGILAKNFLERKSAEYSKLKNEIEIPKGEL